MELEPQAADIEAARTLLEHALRCPAKEPTACPRFWTIVDEQVTAVRTAPNRVDVQRP